MTCSELGEAGGSGSLCSTEMIFLDTGIWWRERNTALSQEPLCTWRQLRQTVLFGYTPVEMKSQKFLSQPFLSVRSPAISPGMQQYTVLMSADPHLNHYFFLCSSAQPMIRGSQGLISSFKTKKKKISCEAVYLPGFDFQIPLSTTAELIIIPYPFKSLWFTSSLDKLSVHFSLA